MTLSNMRRLTIAFFVVYLVALTFPGYLPFSEPRPFVLGLPLSFAWVILWVILGWAVLAALYFVERRERRE